MMSASPSGFTSPTFPDTLLAGVKELYRVSKKSEGNFHAPQLPYKRFAVANVTKLGLCSLEVNCTYIY